MNLKNDIVIPANLDINPYTYLDIVLKYESYLRLINYFGGYMFFKHIYKFSQKSEKQTYKDIHEMKKSKLLKIISLNNNSYVLLTKSSIRYLKNKPNVAYLLPPTSTQLKTCCYLAEYIDDPKEFFNRKKPYEWFIDKYKLELKRYKENETCDTDFLIQNKEKVKLIKEEENKASINEDKFTKLKTSRIYIEKIEEEIIDFIILDFERSKTWIQNSLVEKIEPIIKELGIYLNYNINILTLTENRKNRLEKDVKSIDKQSLMFLKNIKVINTNIDNYFQANIQKESFLKDIDRLEISMLQEKLKNNTEEKIIYE